MTSFMSNCQLKYPAKLTGYFFSVNDLVLWARDTYVNRAAIEFFTV